MTLINSFRKSGSKPSDEKLYNNSVIGAIEVAIITLNDEGERLNKKGKKSLCILLTLFK